MIAALVAATTVLLAAPLAAVPLAVTAAPAACVATDGAFTWGFKESFRAYISGSIANGEWSTDGGIGYSTPAFGSDELTGTVQLDAVTGELAVDGAMRFTGHDGILDTTITDPRLRFEGFNQLVMVVDITGTTQDFVEVSAFDVPFVTGDLAAAEWRVEGDRLVIDQIPLVLTDDGAEAFGTYPAGEQFDPITVELEAGSDCAADALAARDAAQVPVPVIVAGVLALTAASVAGVVMVRARRQRTA